MSDGRMTVEDSTGTAGEKKRGIVRRIGGGAARGTGWLLAFFSKLALVVGIIALGLFVGGFFQFANTVTGYATPADPKQSDAIVALTGGTSRIAKALDLMVAEKGERLLISGVNPDTTKASLARLNSEHSATLDCCVDIETAALDTFGNAVETAKWMEAQGFKSLTLVTSDYHMPRSLLEFRRHAPSLIVEPYPVKLPRLEDETWYRDGENLRFMISEYAKYVGALMRNYLTPKRLAILRSSVLGD